LTPASLLVGCPELLRACNVRLGSGLERCDRRRPRRDHPWRHPFAGLPHAQIRSEIARAQAVLTRLGARGVLFRPPGGTVSPFVLRTAAAHGLRVVLSSVDARDWVAGTTADQIVARVLGAARAGSIVVMHDGGGDREPTLEALPRIVAGIRRQGLRLVALAPTG
jgi:peptidoglycan/xylan/chitin deacetylase (PgdA/CDA1 family)